MSDTFFIDAGLYLAYILIGGGALIAFVIFPIINLVRHPESIKFALGAIVFLAAIFGLGYLIASGETFPSIEDQDYSYQQLRLMGAALYSFFILVILTFASMIISEIISIFR